MDNMATVVNFVITNLFYIVKFIINTELIKTKNMNI